VANDNQPNIQTKINGTLIQGGKGGFGILGFFWDFLGFWDFQNPKVQIVNYEIST
jgi:hypothetical protein